MINFTKLNIEYTTFWQTHSLANAVSVLREVDFYISGGKYDTFLLPYKDIFEPPNIIAYYRLMGSTLTLKEIAAKIPYSEIVKSFAAYLEYLIKQITDYEKKLEAQKKLGIFNQLIAGAGDIISILTSKGFVFAIVGIIAYYLYNN